MTGIIRTLTEKPDEISDALVAAFECGTTKIAAKGDYSNSDRSRPECIDEKVVAREKRYQHALAYLCDHYDE